MKPNYSIERVDGVLVVRFEETPTLQEISSAIEVLAKTEDNSLRLWVFRKDANFSSAEIVQIANHHKSLQFPPSRMAVVAPTDLAYGLARMHEVYRSQDNQIQAIFRTEQEAFEWILQK